MTAPVILMTGATNGIGKEAARQLLECGYHVVIVGRRVDKTKKVLEELRQSSARETVSALIAEAMINMLLNGLLAR